MTRKRKLKTKLTSPARLRVRSKYPIPMVGAETAPRYNWQLYWNWCYEDAMQTKRGGWSFALYDEATATNARYDTIRRIALHPYAFWLGVSAVGTKSGADFDNWEWDYDRAQEDNAAFDYDREVGWPELVTA